MYSIARSNAYQHTVFLWLDDLTRLQKEDYHSFYKTSIKNMMVLPTHHVSSMTPGPITPFSSSYNLPIWSQIVQSLMLLRHAILSPSL